MLAKLLELALDGLLLAASLTVFVGVLALAWSRAEGRRAAARRRALEWQEEPRACVMQGVGGGRVCALCGQGHDQDERSA